MTRLSPLMELGAVGGDSSIRALFVVLLAERQGAPLGVDVDGAIRNAVYQIWKTTESIPVIVDWKVRGHPLL